MGGRRVRRSGLPLKGTAPGSATAGQAGWAPAAQTPSPGLSRVDLVVHSLKDVPTVLPPAFTIGAVCK